MTAFEDSKQFRDVLKYVDVASVMCSEEVHAAAPDAAKQIVALGMPPSYADWFTPVSEVILWPTAVGRTYDCDRKTRTIGSACLIGTNIFGDIVVDADTGCIVDLDRTSGQSHLINTSYARFLYFVGRMNKSSMCQYADASSLFAEFSEIDPIPMKNNNGIWAVTTFEAEEGMY